MRNKKVSLAIIIIASVTIIGLYVLYPWLFFVICKRSFPKIYDTEKVVIHSYLSTMVGRSDIIIYGNGSAYYLKRMEGEMESKLGTLSKEKINEILSIFRDKGFFCLKEYYQPLVYLTDLPSYVVSITMDNTTKSVNDYGRSAPPQFHYIVRELENAVKDLPSVSPSQVCDVVFTELKKMLPHLRDRENFCSYYEK